MIDANGNILAPGNRPFDIVQVNPPSAPSTQATWAYKLLNTNK